MKILRSLIAALFCTFACTANVANAEALDLCYKKLDISWNFKNSSQYLSGQKLIITLFGKKDGIIAARDSLSDYTFQSKESVGSSFGEFFVPTTIPLAPDKFLLIEEMKIFITEPIFVYPLIRRVCEVVVVHDVSVHGWQVINGTLRDEGVNVGEHYSPIDLVNRQ